MPPRIHVYYVNSTCRVCFVPEPFAVIIEPRHLLILRRDAAIPTRVTARGNMPRRTMSERCNMQHYHLKIMTRRHDGFTPRRHHVHCFSRRVGLHCRRRREHCLYQDMRRHLSPLCTSFCLPLPPRHLRHCYAASRRRKKHAAITFTPRSPIVAPPSHRHHHCQYLTSTTTPPPPRLFNAATLYHH